MPNVTKRIQEIYAERGLMSFRDVPFQAQMECFQDFEYEILEKLCYSKNINPSTVVVDEQNLNRDFVCNHTEFKWCYNPRDILNTIKKLNRFENKSPDVMFNFLSGNYHFSRVKLLEKFFNKGLLNDDTTYWSQYRFFNNDRHGFEKEFLQFLAQFYPRTFKADRFYNEYPENLDIPGDVYINDTNNQDTYIFENSLISIVVDTMSNLDCGTYIDNDAINSTYHNVYPTIKTFKPILHKRPFITTIGKCSHNLPMLRQLGFETFYSVWDETYDTLPYTQRIDAISELCYNLSKLDTKELYRHTKDICEHNYNVLINTDWAQFTADCLDQQL